MTMTQLSYFVSVVEMHSLTKVANENHVSQPAVSSAIRDLEKEFGIQLFYRSHRELTLTQEGAEFYKNAAGLVNHFHTFRQEMMKLEHDKLRCSFGITRNLATVHLPGLYRHLKRNASNLSMEIHEEETVTMLRMVKNGLLDVACITVSQSLRENSDLHFTYASTFSLKFFAHREFFFIDRDFVLIEDIASIPLALYQRNTTINQSIRSRFNARGLTPNILCEVNQLSTIYKLVSSGLSGGILPEQAFSGDSDVCGYNMDGYDNIPVYLVWKQHNDIVDLFLRHAHSYFQTF